MDRQTSRRLEQIGIAENAGKCVPTQKPILQHNNNGLLGVPFQ